MKVYNTILFVGGNMIDIIGLRSRRKKLPLLDDLTWVYFLFLQDVVVYVGQTVTGITRIISHIREGDKLFDSYCYINVGVDKLLEVENYYISKFKPRYNKTLNLDKKRFSPQRYHSIEERGSIKKLYKGLSVIK
jgi:hypothetical protein